MPGGFDYDLFTLGAGSGGVAGSRRAASYGARVAIAENWRVGGTCVLRGCVPKKLLVYGVHFAHEMEDARGYGWTVEGSLDWGKLVAAKNRETDRLEGIYKNLLSGAKVETMLGHARVKDAHTVEVDGKTYTSKYILIATGGRPERPDIPGIGHTITSNEALDLPELPRRVLVVGGGYIAVEFAGIFRAAGAEVTIVIRGDKILRGFDEDVRDHLTAELRKQGISIRTGEKIARIDRTDAGDRAMLESGGSIEVDRIMYATGRVPNTRDMGLEAVGVHVDKRGGIAVDEWQQTTVPGIYAIGDVTNRINLTPVAIAEGRGLAETLFNANPMTMDHGDVPSAVFSQPPVGTVGLSEGEAVRLYGAEGVDIYRAVFRPMKHTLSGRDEKTLMKLVVEASTGRVRGVHMVGADAPEIIQGIAIAVKAGLTKKDFDRTVAIHPTASEEFVLMREKVKR
ncbi:MAG: glutathione-disulfide reductase [Proteobacteria bacterium]|nr:glutathione-disulfide reductase [Pseudomonadota bacterium]